MSFFILAQEPHPFEARRRFLGRSGLLLSGAAVALLAGRDALAAKGGASTESDVRVLNTALGAELEAIAAYQVGAESGLLQKPVLDLAVTFQGHHKEHADLLSKTVAKLGGKPVAAKAKYTFPDGDAEDPGRRAALRRDAGERRGQRLSRRGAGVRQSRPGQGRGEHPRRRGDALGDPAQRAGRGAGSVGIRVLKRGPMGAASSPALRSRSPRARRRRQARSATRRQARRSTSAVSPATRSRTIAPAPGTADCSGGAPAA